MALHDLDSGTPLGSGIVDVQRRVCAALGYSFAEFRRAVVLPQFEFRAFLEADASVRAQILERVTGTELYAALSRKAFERAKEERTRLTDLEARGAGLPVLTPEERVALDAEVERLADARKAACEAKRRAEGEVRWHEAQAMLSRELSEAQDVVAGAAAAVEAASDRRRALAETESAEPLRPPRDEAVRTARALEGARRAAESAATALVSAGSGQEDAGEAHRKASKALAEELTRLAALQPALALADALDVRLREVRARAEGANRAAHQAAKLAKETREELGAVAQRAGEEEQTRAAAERWIEERSPERALVDEWPRWQARLAEHATLGQDLTRAEQVLEKARERLAAAVEAHKGLEVALADREADLAAATKVLEQAKGEAGRDNLSAIAAEVGELADRRDALSRLASIAAEAKEEAEEASTAASQRVAAAGALQGLTEEERKAGHALAVASGALTAAREALARLDAALSLEEQRALLTEGEACPLCGATEHPYAAHAPTESARRDQARAVAVAEGELSRLQASAGSLAVARARIEEQLRRARKDEDRQRKALDEAQGRYVAAVAAAGSLGDRGPLPEQAFEAIELLTVARAGAERLLSERKVQQREALTRAEAVRRARERHDRARKADGEVRSQLEAARLGRERAEGEEKAATLSVNGLTARRGSLEEELSPPLSFRRAWQEEARGAPAALATLLEGLVATHHRQAGALRAAGEAIARLGAECEATRAALAEREAVALRLAQSSADERAAVAALEVERSGLLGGRSAAEVREENAALERERRKASEDTASRLGEAEVRLATAVANHAATWDVLTDARSQAGAAAGALDAALAERALDRPRLDGLLARGNAWMAHEREALRALDQAQRDAATLREERARRLAEHAAGCPASTPEEAQQAVATAAGTEERLAEELTRLLSRRAQDDANLVQRAALGEELARQQRETARWESLSDLIGSAGGDVFRVFAQGLTLQALLQAANQHLEKLAPRYRLEAVPRCDLDLQVVDRDLGDEARGVNGLSGGESFLVSLALALGLSSLSGRQTQARTLFIDEGFGTLDRDTLEQAMAAIEQLGSGERTVGVISHVPELHERIGVKVEVERVSAGRSRLVLPDGALAAREGGQEAPRRAS